jgi:uncharacterized lipoprotein YddW (UPF0748 family)
MWVVRFSLSSPQAVHQIVEAAKTYHFNTLFVQVRGRGDAWYQSDLEPRAEALKDQPKSFDPLAQIIAEAHADGIEVHAWVNTYLTWTGKRFPLDPKHIMNAHPDWIARDRSGKYSMVATNRLEGAFVQPSNPAVQNHLFKVYTDIARRYDIDGIHFDFVRYADSDYDFADSTLKRFQDYMKPYLTDVGREAIHADGGKFAYVHTFPDRWAQWRRDQVTGLVKRISIAVHRIRPGIVVSAAVFANAEDAYKDKGQDWAGWLKDGYLDAVCPMAYSESTETVVRQIRGAIASADGHEVIAGIGAWRLSPEDTAKKIQSVLALGANGFNLFSYDDMTRGGTDMTYLDYLSKHCFSALNADHTNTAEKTAQKPDKIE